MINLYDISKCYGHTTAINHITAKIDVGKIYCLLGCNGAGKTTLMKLMAGYINTDTGRIEIAGKPVGTAKMPDAVSFIESSATQFNTELKNLIQMASSLDDRFDSAFAKDMVKKFHLDRNKRYGQLPFGMQTMFNTLLSLASGRDIILLDEPLLGLDAVMRNKFYNLLNESMAHNPRTIIISTHLIDEMIKCVEELIIMDKGNILFRCTIDDIDEKAFSLTGITSDVEPAIRSLNVLAKKTVGKYTTAFLFDEPDKITDKIAIQHMGLQDFFINIVGGDYDEE